jgi:hypothetical protein
VEAVIAYSGPFWPFFLHVLGAMTLFGGILAAVALSFVGLRDGRPFLRGATFWALLSCVPDYVVMRIGAQWTYRSEHLDQAAHTPKWVNIGFAVADSGVLILLAALGAAFWWRHGGRIVAGRIAFTLSGVYLLLLALAWLAMTGKWA